MLRNALTTTAAAALLAGAAFAQDAAQPAAPTMETQEEGTAVLPQGGDTTMGDDPAVTTGATDAEGMTEEPMVEEAEELDPTAPPADESLAADPVAPLEGDDMAADDMGMEGYAAVDLATVSADRLMGAEIVNYENETIATIEDVILTDQGQVDGLVARFGGFLGFGTNQVQLTMDEIELMQDESETLLVRTQLTPEEIESRPEYEPTN